MAVDSETALRHGKIQQPTIFLLLCFLTFGLYAIWWNYRQWRFFKEKYDLDLMPAVRALFSIFFIHLLLEQINYEAREKGYPGIAHGLNATLYVVTSIIANVIGRLPAPYFLFSIGIAYYAFLVPSLNQLNAYWEQEAPDLVQRSLSAGDKIALAAGLSLWGMFLIGLLAPAQV